MSRTRQRKKVGTLHRPTGTPLDMRPKKGASPPSDPAARDTAWAAALRSYDEATASAAYAEIYTLYFCQMLAYGQRSCHLSAADAEDVAQDMFFRIWQRRRVLRIRGTIERYLLRAICNGARDLRRKGSRRDKRENEAAADDKLATDGDVEAELDYAILVARMATVLDTLAPRQRRVITLRIIDRLTIAAIISATNISESTVRAEIKRALDRLSVVLLRYDW